MKQNKKIIIIGVLFAMVVIGTFALIKMNSKGSNQPSINQNGEYVELRQPTDVVQKMDMITPDNTVLADTDWFDSNNAPLVFVDGKHWVWYQSVDMNADDAISGTYETYYGKNAYDALSDEQFANGEGKPTASENSVVIKLTVLNIKADGEETLENPTIITMMGTVFDTELSLIDVDGLTTYVFNAEPNPDIEKADMKAEEIMKDITYSEDMEAWKNFELKVNGENMVYPFSAHALMRAGLSYDEPNEDTGFITLTLEENEVGNAIFSNRVTDELSYLSLKQTEGLNITLGNGVTWGDGEEEILNAYGEPTEIVRGSANEKIYRYNDGTMQMELSVFTEDSNYGNDSGLTYISIHNFINK